MKKVRLMHSSDKRRPLQQHVPGKSPKVNAIQMQCPPRCVYKTDESEYTPWQGLDLFREVSSFGLRAPYMSGPLTALSLSPEGTACATPLPIQMPLREEKGGKEGGREETELRHRCPSAAAAIEIGPRGTLKRVRCIRTSHRPRMNEKAETATPLAIHILFYSSTCS